MSAHEVIIWVMAAFAALGALDRIFGNKIGIGKEFEEGIAAMGGLALAMLGIISLAPALAKALQGVVVPVYSALGADPAMFAGSILACDMGGGALAQAMAQSPQAAALGGVLAGSMLGATVVFTIPVAMGILKEEDRPAMAKGILCGIITIPLGLLDILVVFMIAYDLIAYVYAGQSFAFLVMMYATVFLSALYLIMRPYLYLMCVTFDIKIRKMFKNALILAVNGLGRNLLCGLAAAVVLLLNVMVFNFIPSLGVAMFFLFTVSISWFFQIYGAWPVLKKHMIDPYYEEAPASQEEESVFRDRG
jgi:ethanolamine transporter EutH